MNADDLQALILDEAVSRPLYWRERDLQMDAGMLLYLRQDSVQDSQKPGFETFKTNWPTEVVDKGSAILNGKEPRYRIPIDRSNQEELNLKSRVEWFVRGFWSEVDRQMFARGWSSGPRSIASKHSLLRGCIASEIRFTKESDGDSPVVYNWWDPRYMYPYYDRKGLNSVLYSVETSLAEIAAEHPDIPIEGEMDLRAKKYIYYDRDWYGVLAEWDWPEKRRLGGLLGSSGGGKGMAWLSIDPDTGRYGPYQHELEQIPVVIAAARQVPILGVPARPLNSSLNLNGNGTDVRRDPFTDIQTPQALWCRNIFATVADQIPEFNRSVAQLKQIIRLAAFGVWKGRTKDGRARPWKVDGSGAINWMKPGEELMRDDAGGPPPGADAVLQILFREIQTGTMPGDLLSTMQQATSGFDRAQMLAVAMNHLGEYMTVFNRWEEQVSQESIRQFRGSKLRATFTGFDARKTPFETTFDGSEITRMFDVRVLREPSLPLDDRANIEMARYLLDPAKPLKSYETVADEYLGVDDPQLERDKIAEDVAETWPPIRFKELAAALQRRNRSPEMIASIMDAEMMEQLRIAAQTKQGQMMLQQLNAALQGTGMSPSTLPPEAANTAVEPGNRMGSGNSPGNPVIYGPNGVPLSGQ